MSDNITNLAHARMRRRIDKAGEADEGLREKYAAFDEAESGPLVAAAPGHYLIDADYHPPMRAPVLAWRVGSRILLPVLSHGTWEGESVIEYPDGVVREHSVGGYGREYDDVAEYVADEKARFEAAAEARKATMAPRTTQEMLDDDIPF